MKCDPANFIALKYSAFLPKFGGLFGFCGVFNVGKKCAKKYGEIKAGIISISVQKASIFSNRDILKNREEKVTFLMVTRSWDTDCGAYPE